MSRKFFGFLIRFVLVSVLCFSAVANDSFNDSVNADESAVFEQNDFSRDTAYACAKGFAWSIRRSACVYMQPGGTSGAKIYNCFVGGVNYPIEVNCTIPNCPGLYPTQINGTNVNCVID